MTELSILPKLLVMGKRDSVIGGCVNETLIADAKAAGRKARNAIKRGDVSVETAFHHSGVGYPYMTSSEASAAFAAFTQAAK